MKLLSLFDKKGGEKISSKLDIKQFSLTKGNVFCPKPVGFEKGGEKYSIIYDLFEYEADNIFNIEDNNITKDTMYVPSNSGHIIAGPSASSSVSLSNNPIPEKKTPTKDVKKAPAMTRAKGMLTSHLSKGHTLTVLASSTDRSGILPSNSLNRAVNPNSSPQSGGPTAPMMCSSMGKAPFEQTNEKSNKQTTLRDMKIAAQLARHIALVTSSQVDNNIQNSTSTQSGFATADSENASASISVAGFKHHSSDSSFVASALRRSMSQNTGHSTGIANTSRPHLRRHSHDYSHQIYSGASTSTLAHDNDSVKTSPFPSFHQSLADQIGSEASVKSIITDEDSDHAKEFADLEDFIYAVNCYERMIEKEPNNSKKISYQAAKQELYDTRGTPEGKWLQSQATLRATLCALERQIVTMAHTITVKDAIISDKDSLIYECYKRLDEDEKNVDQFRVQLRTANKQILGLQSELELIQDERKFEAREADLKRRQHSWTVIRLEREKQAIREEKQFVEEQLKTEKMITAEAEKKLKYNEEMREQYDFYAAYYRKQQALYHGYFVKWDADYEERIIAAGGVPELPADMPPREEYDEEPEIIQVQHVRMVNIKAPAETANEVNEASSTNTVSEFKEVDDVDDFNEVSGVNNVNNFNDVDDVN